MIILLFTHAMKLAAAGKTAQFISQRPSGTHNKHSRFFIDVVHMRKYYVGKKNTSRDFDGFICFHPRPPSKKKWFLVRCLYICMDGWMWASLASGRLQGYYSYSVPKSVSATGRFPVNMNIPAPQMSALQKSPETQNGNFLQSSFFSPLALQTKFWPWPTSMKLSVSLQFTRS
jgi:hypothetical protein